MITTDAGQYIAFRTELATAYRDALTRFSTQMAAANENGALLDDESWQLATTACLVAIRMQNDGLRAIKPPAIYVRSHKEMLKAARHFDAWTRLFNAGLQEADGAKLTAAMDEMQQGDACLNRSTAWIQLAAHQPGAAGPRSRRQ